MPIANTFNPNPTTVDSLLRQRQTRVDLGRVQGTISPPPTPDQKRASLEKSLGAPIRLGNQTTITPEPLLAKAGAYGMSSDSSDSFGAKVLKDAALLSYAIPTGLARLASGLLTHPIDTAKEFGGGFVQSIKDTVNPDYYKAHPLLGVVNLAGFVAPVADLAVSAGIKTAANTALETAVKEAVSLGAEESVARNALRFGVKEVGGVALNKGALGEAVYQAAKSGDVGIVAETVKNLLKNGGVADEIATRVSATVSDNLYSTFSRQTTKAQVLNTLSHPVDAATSFIADKSASLRKLIFGEPANTAVATIYGEEAVAKNPGGFLDIERWADAQVKEQGLPSTVANRQRVMQSWVEQNSQWASLTPDEKIAHFRNYAQQDLTRLAIHDATGIDVVTTKALPQNYVDAMVETLKDAPKDMDVPALLQLMEDTYGQDFKNHSAEVTAALAKANTKGSILKVISKLGDARSTISFAKFSPDVQALANDLEKTGYRIAHAPTNKAVSFATDIFKGAGETAQTTEKVSVPATAELAKRTAFGNWIDRLGLSPGGTVEGSAEFAYRENFTQEVLDKLAKKYGGILKATSLTSNSKVSIPVEKLFEWLDKNKPVFRALRPKLGLPVRTVFDLGEEDLVRAGFAPDIAKDIISISKSALNDVPASVTGMGDKVVNFLRTRDKGYNAWMSNVYDKYLKVAYKGRYDLSPFFSAQEFVETKLNSALFLKDPRRLAGAGLAVSGTALGFGGGAALGGAVAGVPGAVIGGSIGLIGGQALTKLGSWTAEKLSSYLIKDTASYLSKIIYKPSLPEVVMVRDEILGTLQKTMLDYSSSPDTINVQEAAMGGIKGLKGQAAFEQSIKSRNLWFAMTGQSSVRMATTFNMALAEKFGFSLEKALDFTFENGQKRYYNPQMVNMMKESTQAVFHYTPGFLTSPLVKTMNLVWFPFRFEAKTVSLISNWASSLSPVNRLVLMNNWVHFANWAGTDEGIQWRRTNRNLLYNVYSYVTAYEQMGQGLEAVAKGRLFGGNAGLVGAVPFGFAVNLARQLAIIPSDPDQYDAKTGRQFQNTTPRKLVSAAAFADAVEQLLVSISPSTPFYSLTGGVISGISPTKIYRSLIQQVVGAGKNLIEGRDPAKGGQMLQRDFHKVPLDYSRLFD